LPGVKELLAPKKQTEGPKRTRYDMYKGINLDYYGFRDEEDGMLVELEKKAQKKST